MIKVKIKFKIRGNFGNMDLLYPKFGRLSEEIFWRTKKHD